MAYDPLSDVCDAPLVIEKTNIEQLRLVVESHKFEDLPGEDSSLEKARLIKALCELVDVLLDGIESNPAKLWVMKQFQVTLELVEQEDTEARERFGTALEEIMGILEIESSDGLLAAYLGGI